MMKNKNQIGFLIILVAAGFSTLAFVIWPTIYATNKQITSQQDRIVRYFYGWYLAYEGNPLVEHAYRSSEYLSPNMIVFLDEVTQDGIVYDPLLCAQNKPSEIKTSPAQVFEDKASVEVSTSFSNHKFSVELVQVNGNWMIDKVYCAQ